MDYFGIDLGTSNTLITLYRKMSPNRLRRRRAPEVPDKEFHLIRLYLPEMKDKPCYTMPSIAYLSEDDRWYVGEPAREMAKQNPGKGRFFKNPKAELENGTQKGIEQDVTREIFLVCIRSIYQYYLGALPDETGQNETYTAWLKMSQAKFGISNPLATTDNFTRNLKSAYKAALKIFREEVGARLGENLPDMNPDYSIHEEPYAALQNYIARELKKGENASILKEAGKNYIALVVDLGGGTTDVAVTPFYLSRDPKDGKLFPVFLKDQQTCLARSGRHIHRQNNAVSSFGGMDFDDFLTAYVITKLDEVYQESGYGFLQEGSGYNRFGSFEGSISFEDRIPEPVREKIKEYSFDLAVNIKHFFTTETETLYESPALSEGILSPSDRICPKISLTREEYAKVIAPLIDDTVARQEGLTNDANQSIGGILKNTFQSAGNPEVTDLDFIFLTGGMSNVCEIRQWLKTWVHGRCPIIWSGEEENQDEKLSNCFIDISYGVSLLASSTQENGLSLAYDLMLDVVGTPEVILKNSTTCPSSWITRSFPVNSVVGIPIRLLSGTGPYGDNLTVEQECVLAEKEIIMPGTTLHFKGTIDEDKQVTITAVYTDRNGSEREEPLTMISRRGEAHA